MPAKRKAAKTDSTATVGFEAKLWLAADKPRIYMDAAEFKSNVLGLIFFIYTSDTEGSMEAEGRMMNAKKTPDQKERKRPQEPRQTGITRVLAGTPRRWRDHAVCQSATTPCPAPRPLRSC